MLTNKKQLITMATVILLLIGLPIVVLISQRQQDDRTKAGASTTIYLTPNSSTTTPIQKNVGETVSFDIMVNPGTNLPSLLKLDIRYDPTKLQTSATNFVANTTAFPQTLEGPLVTNGSVLVSLSIGSDSTKAIQTTTKVGTITFTTLAPTSTTATVSFGSKSQVLSLAQGDQSTENVLSTTTPGYVTIVQNTPTASPTITVVPTFGNDDTPTPTTIPTATLTPTKTPTPTAVQTITTTISPTTISTTTPTMGLSPTLIPSAIATTFTFDVLMHGIGNSGDNVNPTEFSMSNKSPKHPVRTMQVFIYNVSNQIVASGPATITYASSSGSFKGTIAIGSGINPGLHTVKVQSPGHLRRLVPGIQTISLVQNNIMPAVTLIAGDVNDDNTINILDYNFIVGCYSDLLPPVSCSETAKVATDLNDDGFVNQFDYNMFLREISVQVGS